MANIPQDFINRELSWLEFNQRVLDEATNLSTPLLERLKFLAISTSNMNEFYMVRVGGLQWLVKEGITRTDPSGMTPAQQLDAITKRTRTMVRAQYTCFRRSIEPALRQHGIVLIDRTELTPHQHAFLTTFFEEELFPVVSPLAVDLNHPSPLLTNLGLNIAIRLKPADGQKGFRYAVVPIGLEQDRLIRLPSESTDCFIPIEEVLKLFADQLFNGIELLEAITFQITRNADMQVQEDQAPDLMSGMESILSQRKTSNCVRLELESCATKTITRFLQRLLKVPATFTTTVPGPLALSDLMPLAFISGHDDLKYAPWHPQCPPDIDLNMSIMDQISKRDFLFCHPYESYEPVVKLVQEAADDPDVLAIKQILYRTSKNSPIIRALKRAAQNGKYVTAMLELKARFDEERNIEWACELEVAGVQVIYGVKKLKTHAKLCMIVRREPQGIMRYMHFGTGNYNEKTAALYSDISYMTCKAEYGQDAAAFFNAITGYSQPQDYLKIAAAPLNLRDTLLDLIKGEIERKKQGHEALIMAKLNSLVDPEIIKALYQASQAGVNILLNIRGICCLKPGAPNLSQNIKVVSIIDRYLEHSRIFYFYHGGEEKLFISSADWMPRNLDRRVELLTPIEDPTSHRKLVHILNTYFKDTSKSRIIKADGSYAHPRNKRGFEAQAALYQAACDAVEDARQLQRTVFEPYTPPTPPDTPD